VTLASFLYEPAVKFLIAAVGGAAALGLFEMAFRLITQSRPFLAAPCQNLLPLYVATYERGGGLRTIYGPATIIVAILAAAGLLCLVLATPWISLIWIGRVEPLLVSYVAMLAGGWLLNMAAMPAFYLGMASGHLRWNILGSGLTTLGAVLIGKVLGSHFGAAGVVAASSFSVALGAVVIAIGNTRAAGIALIPAFTSVSTLVNAVTGRLKGRA
jgi:O-antigen/teichoic acid export membrane protein